MMQLDLSSLLVATVVMCLATMPTNARTVSSGVAARSLSLFDSGRTDGIIPPAADSVPSAPDALLEAAVGALAAQSQAQSHVIGNEWESANELPVANSPAASSPFVASDDQLDVILKVLGNNKRTNSLVPSNPVVLDPLEELRLRKSDHYCTFSSDCISCVTPNHVTCCYKTRKGAGQRGVCKCTELAWEIRGHCD